MINDIEIDQEIKMLCKICCEEFEYSFQEAHAQCLEEHAENGGVSVEECDFEELAIAEEELNKLT